MKPNERRAGVARFLQQHQTACILVLLALLTLPIFVVGLYNRQSADDYSYAILTRQAFVQYGFNPLRLLAAAFDTTVKYFYTWQGLYTSAFLLSLQPAIFGEQLYALAPVLVVAFLGLCVFLFFRRVSGFLFPGVKGWPVLAGLFLFYVLQCMPSPVQGIYWFNGAGNYMPFWGLCLLTVCLLLRLWQEEAHRARTVVLLCVIAFLTSGGNHVSAFLNLLLLALGTAALLLGRRKPLGGLLPLLVGVAGFVFNITSPGTAVRQNDYFSAHPGVVQAIAGSIVKAAFYLKEWCGPAFLLYLCLITPLAFRLGGAVRGMVNGWMAAGSLVLTMGLVAAMLCVPYYAMGEFGSGRLTNIVWMTFVAGITLSYLLATAWMLQTGRVTQAAAALPEGAEVLLTAVLCGLVVFYGNNASYSTTAYALQELANGDAAAYAAQLDSRIPLLNDPTVREAELDPITVGPYLLYFSDVTEDADNWQNQDAAAYYGKDRIVLTGPILLD